MPLLSLVASNPEAVYQLTIEQVVATAGDGRLRDATDSQRELREYLGQVSINALATYADYCLTNASRMLNYAPREMYKVDASERVVPPIKFAAAR